jgi:hypothetical protein
VKVPVRSGPAHAAAVLAVRTQRRPRAAGRLYRRPAAREEFLLRHFKIPLSLIDVIDFPTMR